MKLIQSSVFRALCAISVGVLLIEYREQTATWLTVAIGALFFLSGVISLATYYSARKHAPGTEINELEGNSEATTKPSLPLAGIGSLVLGIILALMPSSFVAGMGIVLALLLAIGAVSQFVGLATARRMGQVGWFFWVMPSVILLASIIIIAFPSVVQDDPLFFIGWCMLLYGVVECTNAVKIHNEQRKYIKAQEAAEAEAAKAREAQVLEQPHEEPVKDSAAVSTPVQEEEDSYSTHTPTQPME